MPEPRIDRATSGGRQTTLTATQPSLAHLVGGGGDQTVVFLHGVGSSASTWDELFAVLGDGFRWVAADLRGHGDSEAPPVPYHLGDFVDDHIRLLDELGIPAAHVVGFSLGAVVAQAIALTHPERTSSLVLLNCIGGRTPAERVRAAERLEVIRTTDPAVGVGQSIQRWFTPQFIERCPEVVRHESAIVAATPLVPYAAAYEVLVTTDLIDEVHTIGVPALVVTGEHDLGSTPRMSRLIAERMPRSELVIVEGLKHYLHVEAASVIAALITQFLQALPRSPHEPDRNGGPQ